MLHPKDIVAIINSEPFIYIPNPGNAGDSFIAAATFKLFSDYGLNYQVASALEVIGKSEIVREKILVYGGGGNLKSDSPSHISSEVIKRAAPIAKRIIILPHTILNAPQTLALMRPQDVIIAREETTYQYLHSVACKATIEIAHDLAFSSASVEEMLKIPITIPQIFTSFLRKKILGSHVEIQGHWGCLCTYFKGGRQFAADRRAAKGGKRLSAFRNDDERSSLQIPVRNIDVSAKYPGYTENRLMAGLTTARFLNFINLFDEVHTNRLHVAIGAARLGKKVFFEENSYYKNRAVFEFSLKSLPNVVWGGVGRD